MVAVVEDKTKRGSIFTRGTQGNHFGVETDHPLNAWHATGAGHIVFPNSNSNRRAILRPTHLRLSNQTAPLKVNTENTTGKGVALPHLGDGGENQQNGKDGSAEWSRRSLVGDPQ